MFLSLIAFKKIHGLNAATNEILVYKWKHKCICATPCDAIKMFSHSQNLRLSQVNNTISQSQAMPLFIYSVPFFIHLLVTFLIISVYKIPNQLQLDIMALNGECITRRIWKNERIFFFVTSWWNYEFEEFTLKDKIWWKLKNLKNERDFYLRAKVEELDE